MVTTNVFAQNDTHTPLNDLGDGNPFFMTIKGSFLPGQLVEISGNLVTVNPVQIILDNPQGMMKASKITFSDRDGYFALELKIPVDAEAGNWTIVGTSGIYHKELNFTILGNSDTVTCYAGNLCSKPIVNNTVQYDPKSSISTGMKSPLKQFKSGITANDVKCNSGLWLVTKTEDGSPACVRPDTAYILIHHGWAKEVSQTSLYTIPTISSTPCDIPYSQSNTGVAVLYMAPNSTGKICATYHNPDSPIQSSIRVFVAKDMQQQATEINTSVYPDIVPTGNSTIVYTIKTGSQAGLYGVSFFCGSIPFAVGYDNQSGIILDDFPWLYKNDICLSQTNVFQIIGLSGIHVKYVTVEHRG